MKTFKTTAGLLFLFALSCTAQPSDYCSVEVAVTLPEGQPINLPVELRDDTGSVVDRAMPANGRVRFCDIAPGVYSIEIGDARECDHVSIRNVVDGWPHPRIIKAIVNPSCDAESMIGPGGCYVALRMKGRSWRASA